MEKKALQLLRHSLLNVNTLKLTFWAHILHISMVVLSIQWVILSQNGMVPQFIVVILPKNLGKLSKILLALS